VIGDDVYVYIVLMLDKAGQQERWGIVKKSGKGRGEKETLDRILWVDIIKRNEQTSLYFTAPYPVCSVLRVLLIAGRDKSALPSRIVTLIKML
jgi:hypothetical protein